jgi:hypothetical protein
LVVITIASDHGVNPIRIGVNARVNRVVTYGRIDVCATGRDTCNEQFTFDLEIGRSARVTRSRVAFSCVKNPGDKRLADVVDHGLANHF